MSEVTVGQEFVIVATGVSDSSEAVKNHHLSQLQRSAALLGKGSGDEAGPWKFQVPSGEKSLAFGSFDNLIRLTDELAKYDSTVDGILHRLERQYIELDQKATFKVKSQRQEKAPLDYIRNWTWDEGKYPLSRSVSDNVTLLMTAVTRLDEEARNKTAQYNEFKTTKGNLTKKEGVSLTNKDLIDVLTPDVVKAKGTADDDFIVSDHFTTIPVILSRGADKEFLANYESVQENVVPMSARKFEGVDDKDGNSVWRVVMMKSAVEGFKKACRERKWIARDFEYSEDAYKKLRSQRDQVDDQVKRQHDLVKALYSAAWSDTLVALMHLKAMRVFVESVLRFGMPPNFAAFVCSPKAGVGAPARKALADLLGKSNTGASRIAAGQDEGEEFFPYVSLSFTPFVVPRDKA